MICYAYQMLATFAPALIHTVAAPLQVGEVLGIPMWGWLLIALAGFLLLTFIVVVTLDWRSTGEQVENEFEE